jgi:hypothetical protein
MAEILPLRFPELLERRPDIRSASPSDDEARIQEAIALRAIERIAV